MLLASGVPSVMTAKKVLPVHGIDANEKVVVRKQLRRSQMIAFDDLSAHGLSFTLRLSVGLLRERLLRHPPL